MPDCLVALAPVGDFHEAALTGTAGAAALTAQTRRSGDSRNPQQRTSYIRYIPRSIWFLITQQRRFSWPYGCTAATSPAGRGGWRSVPRCRVKFAAEAAPIEVERAACDII